MFPSDTVDVSTRIGSNGALRIQADNFSESIVIEEEKLKKLKDEINKVEVEKNNLGNNVEELEKFIDLEESQLELREKVDSINLRIEGLREARELTLEQKDKEETKAAQEGDITRLEKFKKWARENLVGLSGLTIGIAGLITTIIVAARKAALKGAQEVSKFSKALAELGKKVWPFLAPIFSIISQVLSWGANGLAFLANNLWILAIAFAWFIYDQYKDRMRRK